jgi:hypothetical protein
MKFEQFHAESNGRNFVLAGADSGWVSVCVGVGVSECLCVCVCMCVCVCVNLRAKHTFRCEYSRV